MTVGDVATYQQMTELISRRVRAGTDNRTDRASRSDECDFLPRSHVCRLTLFNPIFLQRC